MTMPRIAGATLPAQKTRKDDHTYHPIMIEGTKYRARKREKPPVSAREEPMVS